MKFLRNHSEYPLTCSPQKIDERDTQKKRNYQICKKLIAIPSWDWGLKPAEESLIPADIPKVVQI